MRLCIRTVTTGLLAAMLAGAPAVLAAGPATQPHSHGWFSGLGNLFSGSENPSAGQSAQAAAAEKQPAYNVAGPTGRPVPASSLPSDLPPSWQTEGGASTHR